MALEQKAPDALLVQDNLTGAVTAIDEDPDTPGADWLAAVSNNVNSVCVVSFPTPTGNPRAGAGLQNFKWWARLTPNGTACTYNVYLRESGVRMNGGAAIATGSLTSTSGQLITATWDAALLGTADGSAVEAELEVVKSGGAPSARTTGEVGAVEWNVDYSTLTAVGESLAAVYDIKQLAGESLAAPYDVKQFAGESLALAYHLRNQIGESAALQYHIAQLAGESLALAYDIESAGLSAVGESLGLPYDIRGLAGESVALPYDVREAIGESLALEYHLRALAGESLALNYDMAGAAGESLALLYHILGTGPTGIPWMIKT